MSHMRERRSFSRQKVRDWSEFTDLVLRVRGDGRSYKVNIHVKRLFDLQWNDLYSFPLHTRGGPYWQNVKVIASFWYHRHRLSASSTSFQIPFDRFMFTSESFIQDSQKKVPLDEVATVSITLSDHIDGPFRLEVDYIGIENSDHSSERDCYEAYHLPRMGLTWNL